MGSPFWTPLATWSPLLTPNTNSSNDNLGGQQPQHQQQQMCLCREWRQPIWFSEPEPEPEPERSMYSKPIWKRLIRYTYECGACSAVRHAIAEARARSSPVRDSTAASRQCNARGVRESCIKLRSALAMLYHDDAADVLLELHAQRRRDADGHAAAEQTGESKRRALQQLVGGALPVDEALERLFPARWPVKARICLVELPSTSSHSALAAADHAINPAAPPPPPRIDSRSKNSSAAPVADAPYEVFFRIEPYTGELLAGVTAVLESVSGGWEHDDVELSPRGDAESARSTSLKGGPSRSKDAELQPLLDSHPESQRRKESSSNAFKASGAKASKSKSSRRKSSSRGVLGSSLLAADAETDIASRRRTALATCAQLLVEHILTKKLGVLGAPIALSHFLTVRALQADPRNPQISPVSGWFRITLRGARVLIELKLRSDLAAEQFLVGLSGYAGVSPFREDRHLYLVQQAQATHRASSSFLQFWDPYDADAVDAALYGVTGEKFIPQRMRKVLNQKGYSDSAERRSVASGTDRTGSLSATQRTYERGAEGTANTGTVRSLEELDKQDSLRREVEQELRKQIEDDQWRIHLLQPFSRITIAARGVQNELGRIFTNAQPSYGPGDQVSGRPSASPEGPGQSLSRRSKHQMRGVRNYRPPQSSAVPSADSHDDGDESVAERSMSMLVEPLPLGRHGFEAQRVQVTLDAILYNMSASAAGPSAMQVVDPLTLRQAIFEGGLARDARRECIPFILGVFAWDSDATTRQHVIDELVQEYAEWTRVWMRALLTLAEQQKSDSATGASNGLDLALGGVDLEAFEAQEQLEGSLPSCDLQRQGRTSSDEWLPLASAQGAVSGGHGQERDHKQEPNDLATETASRCDAAPLPEQSNFAAHIAYVTEIRAQILKDVVRTDRSVGAFEQGDESSNANLSVMQRVLSAYAMKDKSIGYCQGMSDFLSPLVHALYVVTEQPGQQTNGAMRWVSPREATESEALVFGCFCRLMKRVGSNFSPDQVSIRKQLSHIRRIVSVVDSQLAQYFERTDPDYYSLYRWVLVQYKREFPFDEICNVWELLWLDHVAAGELHLYMAAALLVYQRDRILRLPEGEFDQIVRFVNSMLTRVDGASAVHLGARLYMRVGRVVGNTSRPRSAIADDFLLSMFW
ncbi:Small G protein signaling modulator 1 [Porphyridium purpureum]|uniref:Small G protein signaling modulator 1 n=1 Tax=Porphyridium purpureum TaxID=35688 RepID=A0A5J4YXK6_PORPP|nr:Small G protein signaling modulator 1 [Porphyridium purpureum]|eukprot:POR8931..scf208_2